MPEVAVNVAHALAIYAESLASRRRVVVIGDSSLGLDARLAAIGARVIHVYDPDAERARANARSAAKGAVIRELPAGDLDVRQGAFDLAIVPDLAAIADRAELLVRVRRLVGESGAAIFAAKTAPEAAPGALDYYEMYDLVALQFPNVRMIGQVPFGGVAFAELGESEEEPAVSVDTQLVTDAPAPELTIALAGHHDVRLEPYAIIQLPGAPAAVRVAADAADAADAAEHAELAAAVLRANLLQTQLDEQRAVALRLTAEGERANRVDELEAALHERTAKLKDAETRAGEHYVRAERLTHEARRAEEELGRVRERAARLAKDLEDERKNRERVEADLGAARKTTDRSERTEMALTRERAVLLEEALRAAEEAADVLQQRAVEADQIIAERDVQIAALATRAATAEARASLIDAQLAEAGDEVGAELARLEGILRERAQAIQSLEREVTRREGIVRELLLALEEAGAVGATAAASAASAASHGAAHDDEVRLHLDRAIAENADLRARLDALALDIARREAELQARAWRISALEERVASLEAAPKAAPVAASPKAPTGSPLAGPPQAEGAVAGPRGELQALRQALAQEHAARVRAESGEELARARADLTRQAVLLEQLSRELEARDRAGAAREAGQEAGPAQP